MAHAYQIWVDVKSKWHSNGVQFDNLKDARASHREHKTEWPDSCSAIVKVPNAHFIDHYDPRRTA